MTVRIVCAVWIAGLISSCAGGDVSQQVASQAPPPPPPPSSPAEMHVVSVVVDGGGKVVSSPAGIDCETTCSTQVSQGSQLQLLATAKPGWELSGFFGACSGKVCAFTIDGEQTVAARFVPSQSPPATCGELLPSTIPDPVVVPTPASFCSGGTSDAAGTYLLSYETATGIGIPVFPHRFFVIREGKPVQTGGSFAAGDEFATFVFAEQSGFQVLGLSTGFGSATLTAWADDGNPAAATPISPPLFIDTVSAGADPAGGIAVLRSYPGASSSWTLTYRRFGPTGAAETPEVPIGDDHWAAEAPGVSVTAEVLALMNSNSGLQGRWLTRDGRPLTAWFAAGGFASQPLSLIDGTVAYRVAEIANIDGSTQAVRRFDRVFRPMETAASDLPGWLQQRAHNAVYVVRDGRGYASFGPDGPCSSALEILDAHGTSCGCVPVPGLTVTDHAGRADLTPGASVGRDGSLIVPVEQGGQCSYRLYPQLLQ